MSSIIRTNNSKKQLEIEKTEMKIRFHWQKILKTPRQKRLLITHLLLVYLLFGLFITSTNHATNLAPTLEKPTKQIAAIFNLNLTWTSRLNEIPTPISPGDRIAGDHIVLKAVWIPAKEINWTRLVVNASAIPSIIEEETRTNIAELDTRGLGNNATCAINVTAGLNNGSTINKILYDVFLGNFFKPSISILSPNGGEVWTSIMNITWQASDLNAEESLTYDVSLLSSPGEEPQLLAKGLTQTWLEWDFSGIVNLSTYKVEVGVTDGIYTSTDFSDDFFTAGTVQPTTTSTLTSETTTTTTSEYDLRIISFLIALIASSILIALVAYFRAKKL